MSNIVKLSFDELVNNEDMWKPKSEHFYDLPQYHFERDVFAEIFAPLIDFIWDNMNKYSDNFFITINSDEFYIIHFPSGTMINWYKHLGRTNTCNKPLTVDDLKEFKRLLLLDFGYIEV